MVVLISSTVASDFLLLSVWGSNVVVAVQVQTSGNVYDVNRDVVRNWSSLIAVETYDFPIVVLISAVEACNLLLSRTSIVVNGVAMEHVTGLHVLELDLISVVYTVARVRSGGVNGNLGINLGLLESKVLLLGSVVNNKAFPFSDLGSVSVQQTIRLSTQVTAMGGS